MAEKARGLAAAFESTPEIVEFIHGNHEKQKTAGRRMSERSPRTPDKKPSNSSRKRQPDQANTSDKQEQERLKKVNSRARVAITIRVTQETADALRKASLERKLRGHLLHTQQEIIETALSMWLQKPTDKKSTSNRSGAQSADTTA